jgi:hypothetical protein
MEFVVAWSSIFVFVSRCTNVVCGICAIYEILLENFTSTWQFWNGTDDALLQDGRCAWWIMCALVKRGLQNTIYAPVRPERHSSKRIRQFGRKNNFYITRGR